MTEPIGFRMNLDTAEAFYKRCIERKAESREERMKVLEELVAEMRALKVTEEDIAMLSKGKKILRIKGDKTND